LNQEVPDFVLRNTLKLGAEKSGESISAGSYGNASDFNCYFYKPTSEHKTFSGMIISELFAYLRLITARTNTH
jgi:hypothetical protein